MADSKLTDLPQLSSVQLSDLLYIVSFRDVAGGLSQKITVEDFFKQVDTSININGNLSASNVLSYQVQTNNIITNELLADNISSKVSVITAANALDITFTDHNSKIINFNTNTNNGIAKFNILDMVEGFNVGITNTGTGTVLLSTNMQLNAIGNTINTRYAGCHVYFTDNKLFAVGNLN